MWLWGVLAIVVAFGLWVRFAPVDPARWHVDVAEAPDPAPGGVKRQANVSLAALADVAAGWPHTRQVAGSVGEGRVTYETRSLLWGFPDYTTIEADGDGVAILARLRFGRSDVGVNGKRVAAWLDAARDAGN